MTTSTLTAQGITEGPLRGRVAAVTGAASGIGAAIAERSRPREHTLR